MINTFRLAGYELRRFKGPLPILALLFLVLVPLLYGALYLWSNWDPYGSGTRTRNSSARIGRGPLNRRSS